MAVELDEVLGGGSVLHREVQGHESSLFLQLFRSVEVLIGSDAAGFAPPTAPRPLCVRVVELHSGRDGGPPRPPAHSRTFSRTMNWCT